MTNLSTLSPITKYAEIIPNDTSDIFSKKTKYSACNSSVITIFTFSLISLHAREKQFLRERMNNFVVTFGETINYLKNKYGLLSTIADIA